jgi:hypothetical protein
VCAHVLIKHSNVYIAGGFMKTKLLNFAIIITKDSLILGWSEEYEDTDVADTWMTEVFLSGLQN